MQFNLSFEFIYICFFFYLGFLSRTFTIHGTAGEGGGYLFNSSLPLPPTSWTLRHQPGDYCRELTFAHNWQPDSNQEPLVSERKSLISERKSQVAFIGTRTESRQNKFKSLQQKYLFICYLFDYKALFVCVKDKTWLRMAIQAYCFNIIGSIFGILFLFTY